MSVVAISPQLEEYSQQLVEKLHLTFPVLSDLGNTLAAQFGLAFALPEDLRQIYKGFGIDLEKFNGDATWTLAMPGRFIVDQQGKILNAEVHPDYTVRPEPSDIVRLMRHVHG